MGPDQAKRIGAFKEWVRAKIKEDPEQNLESLRRIFDSDSVGILALTEGSPSAWNLIEWEGSYKLHLDWKNALWAVLSEFEDT